MALMEMNDYGIVIVAFNPDLDEFIPKVKRYDNLGGKVIVVNNSISDIDIIGDVEVINLGKNVGIAKAQNIGVRRLTQLGVQKFFLFDQDSSVENDYFIKMLSAWDEIKKVDDKVGIIAPAIFDHNMEEELATVRLDKDKLSKIKFKTLGINRLKNTLPISSGILTTTNVFNDVDGNDGEMFIDWVDFKFDLDVIQAGYSTYSVSDATVHHKIGNAQFRKLLWKTIPVANYSPFREYYYFRNGIYFYRTTAGKYPQFKKYIRRELRLRIVSFPYERKKLQRLISITKGIIDGLKAKEVN